MKPIIIASRSAVAVLLGFGFVLPAGVGSAFGQDAKPPEKKSDDMKMVPGPWFPAKVGDTIVHRDSLGQQNIRKITKADETEVTVESMGKTGGKDLPKHIVVYPRMISPDRALFAAELKSDPKTELKDLGTETLTISGIKIVCKVRQTTVYPPSKPQQPTVRKFWTSDKIPGNVVKVETTSGDFKYVNELIEFKPGK